MCPPIRQSKEIAVPHVVFFFLLQVTLGHEFGAGAACLKCKDKCEGFELHFWRFAHSVFSPILLINDCEQEKLVELNVLLCL